jgi:peptidoglycan/xylan/chitin deacetylase (PgdA/CDA1 family)
MPGHRHASLPASRLLLAALAAVALVSIGGPGAGVPTAQAAIQSMRLEAGPHSGIKFSSTGAVLQRKSITLASPTTVSSDRRRTVPTRSGFFLRMTTGPLAGWEIRESLLAHIPGKVGDVAYSPAATATLEPGRYLGYTFDADWDLASTHAGTLATAATASASRRAVIDGRSYVLIASGTWSGYWMPVTAPRKLSAQRIRCSVPAKVAAGSMATYRRVSTTDREMALTFDMGGRMTPALDIMERLIVDRVCSTIFPTGAMASTSIGRAVMELIEDHPELFEVANHTQNHCNLRDGGGPAACPTGPATTAEIQKELLDAEAVVRTLSGLESAPYWRPPYGASDLRVRTAAAGVGYTKNIMWDIDTIDWRRIADGGPTAGSMSAKVVDHALTGSIVLLHLGGYHTYDALPSMVTRLRAANLQPTTVSALLR